MMCRCHGIYAACLTQFFKELPTHVPCCQFEANALAGRFRRNVRFEQVQLRSVPEAEIRHKSSVLIRLPPADAVIHVNRMHLEIMAFCQLLQTNKKGHRISPAG